MSKHKKIASLLPKKPEAPYVYIAGAGPGDAGLLTLKLYQILQEHADIVIYDRLIGEDILNLIPSHVKRIYAGKSCKKHHMTQEEINQSLVEEAQKGQVVVRLKGGDPFIFGRGGEEALHLMENKVPFEIIPGVNAADASAAVLGIPLTHRGVATAVRFITGHQQKGVTPLLDYASLADPNTTLVIFMGLAHLEEIIQGLMAQGLEKKTPIAIIEQATLPAQKYIFSTFEKILDELKTTIFQPPSIVIIGKTVSVLK